MNDLTARHTDLLDTLLAAGLPAVAGPPFTVAPAAPVVAVAAPQLVEYLGVSAGCHTWRTVTDVLVVATMRDGLAELLTLTEQTALALAEHPAVVTGGPDPGAYPVAPDTIAYRLTVED